MKQIYFMFGRYSGLLKLKISVTALFMALFLSANLLNAQTYCIPTYSWDCSVGDDIEDFILLGEIAPGINNLSTVCDLGGYSDYTSMEATLFPGNTYSGNVTTSYGFPWEDVRIWIDYNNNGVFENAEEIATLDKISSSSTGAFTFTVPTTVSQGTYRLRVRLVYDQTASTIDPCISYSYGETHDYSIVIPSMGTNNAGIVELTSPVSFCAGTEDIKVMVKNAGINIIDSVKIGWELNGVSQTPVLVNTPLDTAGGVGINELEVTLGSHAFTNTPVDIKAWTYDPNGVVDTANYNDTITEILQAIEFSILTPSDSVCYGGDMPLTLSSTIGTPSGAIAWQTSMDGTVWTDIPNSNGSFYLAENVIQKSYFRARIGSPGSYCYTDFVQLEVIEVEILSVQSGERCGTGAIDLFATGEPGTEILWYEEEIGGASIGAGSSFVTPVLSSTDTFYVSASITGGLNDFSVGLGALTSNSGSGGSYEGTSPYAYHYGNYKHQMLIRADELIAAGMQAGSISSIAFEVVSTGTATFNNFNIAIGETSNTVMGANFESGLTTVFTGNVLPIVGRNTYSFNAPFIWDGVSNLIIQTCYNNNNSGSVANSAEVAYDLTSYVSHTIFRADGTQSNICDELAGNNANDGPTISKRPMVVFEAIGSCQSPREMVIATIKPVPTVALGNDTTICQGSSLLLDAGNSGLDFKWNDNSTNQTLTVNSSGIYSVTVTDTANCSASDTIDIEITNPVVNLGNDTIICEGVTLTLDAGNPGMTYEWNDNSTGQTFNVTNTGTYYVTVSNDGCQDEDTIHVEVVPMPIVDLGEDTIVCKASSLVLDAGNPGMDYIWNDNSINQTLTVTANGTYSVTVTNSADCAVSDTIQVQFAVNPTRNFDPSINLCIGDTLNLNAGNAGSSFEWSTSAVTQSIRLHQAGTYTVKVTNSSGCSDTFSTLIIHRNLPVINLGNDTIICRGDSINLDAENSPGSIYTWSTGENDRIITVGDEETYTVTVTNQYGCISSGLRRVFHFEDPFVEGFNFVPVGQQGSGQRVDFFPIEEENVIAYEWDFGDGSPISTDRFPSHVYDSSGVFTVKLRVFNECEYYEVFLPVNVDLTTGVITIDGEVIDINLYPNPSNNQIVIEHHLDNVKMKNITIYNTIGSVVHETLVSGSMQEIISVSHLASGMYLVQIMTDKGRVVKRFEVIR